MKNPKEIGRILKEARQKKGLNFDSLWKATRIQARIAGALEEGKADEILSRIYVILFLRKYASFLDLDGDSLAEEYKAFFTAPEEQVLDISERSQESNIDPRSNIDVRRWMLFAASAGIIVIVLSFLMLLGAKVKSFYRARQLAPQAVVAKPAKKPISIDESLEKIFPIPKGKRLSLGLHSLDDVWMKVRGDEKVIFEGTLRKDKKKDLSAEDGIKLWVGRAEALDFTINGVFVGRIGKGNIKNIEISRDGLKIGKKWLKRVAM